MVCEPIETMRGHDELWRSHSSCLGVDPDIFYPTKGQKGGVIEAQRICATCPVQGDCLQYAILNREPYGIWGGAGEGRRKALRRLLRDSPHPEKGVIYECECDYCTEVAIHFERLVVLAMTGRGPSPARPTFGSGARHGRRSTGKRGCKCEPCRAALRPDYEAAS